MLVLTRKPDESIKIGEDVTITIVDISGGKVKIGVAAPKNIRVLRTEVYETEKHNSEAAVLSPSMYDFVSGGTQVSAALPGGTSYKKRKQST
jgi:carbon storage regulator